MRTYFWKYNGKPWSQDYSMCEYGKTEHLLLMKKVVAPFDKKVPVYRKKRTDNPRKESITENPFEEPITKKLKRTLSLRAIKRTLSLRNRKKTQSLRNVKRTLLLRNLNDFCAAKNSFWIFVYPIWYSGWWGKIIICELWPWKASFSHHSHLKIEVK